MCIDCYKSAITHLIAMIAAGKAAEPARAPHLEEAAAQHEIEAFRLIGGDLARVLKATMMNEVRPDGEFQFSITEENVQAISAMISMFDTERLWTLALMLRYAHAQFDVTEDVVLDAMKARAKSGDLKALYYLGGVRVHEVAPGVSVVEIGRSSRCRSPATCG
jgi:hypothetical protein